MGKTHINSEQIRVNATDRVLGRLSAGAGEAEEIAVTAAARSLLDDNDIATMRTTLGLGTMALEAALSYLLKAGGTMVGDIAMGANKITGGNIVMARPNFGVAYAKYDFSVDGGAQTAITPVINTAIPDNALLMGGIVGVVTGVTSGGSATVAIGTSAGSSATSLLAATAKATLVADYKVTTVTTFAAPIKMSAAGNIIFTVGTAALTAGVIEVWVIYALAAG